VTFLVPVGLGFGIALPLLLLLYLLKVRRTERVISSVLLWETFQRDLAARDPWQRLRWSVLLVLQLVLLGALVLALARPAAVLPAPPSSFLAIVVDSSPSMAATDVAPNRLEVARGAAHELVDAAPDGTSLALIEARATARVIVSETPDRQAIDRGLDGIAPAAASIGHDPNATSSTDPRSIDDALRIAGALAHARPGSTIHLFSDGAYSHPSAWDDLALTDPRQSTPVGLRFHPIGTAVGNRAITALALSPGPSTADSGAAPQLFARIQNFDSHPASIAVTLDADGKTVETRAVDLPAEGTKPLFFENLPATARAIQLRITPGDTLADDKIATLVRGDPPSVPILLVSRGNLFLQKALQSIPGLAVFQIAPRAFPAADTSAYAVVIFDGYVPDRPPSKDAFLINPPDSPWLPTQGTLRDPPITLWRSEDPTLAYVDLASVRVARANNVILPDWAHPLIESNGLPLAFVGANAGRRIVGLTFDVQQSNFPLSAAFPIFVANVMRYLTPNTAAQAAYLRPGQPAIVRPPPGVDRITIDGPNGRHWEINPSESAPIFDATGRVGLYQATDYVGPDVAATQQFAVNLFDPSVSDVRPRAGLVDQTAPPLASAPNGHLIHEYAPWLLALALPLLLIEWWWFHRR
jgi:Ca-activated chloride channel family protein